MKTIYIIYVLQIQDGENRYKHFSPQEIIIPDDGNDKEHINKFGEELASSFYNGKPDQNNDWYYFRDGTIACRFYSFKVIENIELYNKIRDILYT